jgi:peptidoglycan-associated lipoprotein
VVGLVLVSLVAGCGKPKSRAREQWTGIDDISEVDSGLAPGIEYEPATGMADLPDRPPEGAYELVEDLFEAVLFDFDSAVVRSDEMYKLDAVATYLSQNTTDQLLVEGHCDERGSREYNMALGERRAQAARNYLIDSGIDPMRIQTKSFGEEMPVDPGHDESAWRLNRRSELKVMR